MDGQAGNPRAGRASIEAGEAALAHQTIAAGSRDPTAHRGRGNGVTDLPMSRSPVSYNLIVIRERLQPGEFIDREHPVSPMKRSRGRPRLGLNGPRWTVLRELEEE